jgi:tetratricopeptide (TPR) repeat protein
MRPWIVPLVGFALLLAQGPGGAAAAPAVEPLLRAYLAQRVGDLELTLASLREALVADPASEVIRTELARLLGGSRDYGAALETVEEGLVLRPRSPKLLLLKARLLELLDRPAEALGPAREAASGGEGGEAQALTIRLLERLERLDEAQAQAAQWAGQVPDSPEAQFTWGRLLALRGDKEQGRQRLRRALELAPNHRAGLRALAALEEEAGNLEAAEGLYRRVIEANPHSVEARLRLGQVLLRRGAVDEAVQVFEAAERWSGGDPGLRFRLGVLLLQFDRPGEAEKVFRQMAEGHQDDSQARYLLGVSLLAQEEYAEALEVFARIGPEDVQYSDALVRRAIALGSLQRDAEARELLEARLAEAPRDEEVLLALAGLHENGGDYRAAVDLLEAYVGQAEVENARVFFTLGVLHDKLKDWRTSAEYMQRSLELRPDDAHALNYLGYTYADNGVYLEEAERLILRALELRPQDGFITDSLGWVYFKQERFEEAVTTLRKAVEIAPKDPVIWEHLGDALRRLDRREQALEAYRKTLEISPDSGSAREKVEQLQ